MIFSVLFLFSQSQSNSTEILSMYINFNLAAKEYALVPVSHSKDL